MLAYLDALLGSPSDRMWPLALGQSDSPGSVVAVHPMLEDLDFVLYTATQVWDQ